MMQGAGSTGAAYSLAQGFDQGCVISKASQTGCALVSMELKQRAVLQSIVEGFPPKEAVVARTSILVEDREPELGDGTSRWTPRPCSRRSATRRASR